MPRVNKQVRKATLRNSLGIYMVELLVAVLCLSFLLAGLMQGLSQMHTQTTAPQNQAIASNICQELFDMARNAQFSDLWSCVGSGAMPVAVNRSSGSWPPSGQPAYITQPLMLDLTSNLGASYSQAGQDNRFRGTVTQTITDVSAAGATAGNRNRQVQITVVVTWPNEVGSGNRTMQMSTRIYENGISN
ncbi:MAG: hypothetical protein K2X27_04700 [Candidatus Obscuribacterales bacterium]|nr:hypothetical protein [Candidatus Obscuribacterales bacterium]